ncbi:MAG: hypothetical protein AAGJ81_13150 [Verrucomicrobiota bacterium]
MKTITLLLRKDFKRYSWALIALTVAALIEIYINGTAFGIQDLAINRILQLLGSFVGGILFFVVIVMVVQEESLRDPDAYWLARPFNRLHVLAAKLLFLLVLLGIGAIGEVVTLVLNGGSSRIGYALAGALLIGLATWQWQVFLAAQTRSLPRYLLLAVILIVGFYVLLAVLLFSMANLDFEDFAVLPADIPGNQVALIQAILWTLGGLGVLLFYYMKRRLISAWALLIPLVLLSLLLQPKDSFWGQRILSDGNTSFDLKLLALEKSGTVYTGGTENVSYKAFFEPIVSDQDVWMTPTAVSLSSDSSDVEVKTNTSSQRLELTSFERRPAVSARIFSIERKELDQITGPVDIRISYRISLSTQTEIGRTPVEQNASLTYQGNRILLSSFSETDDQLNLNFRAYIPAFAFEPSIDLAAFEPLSGRFSFGVSERVSNRTIPSEIFSDWGGWGFFEGARLEVPNATLSPAEYEIIFFTRTITESESEFLTADDLTLNGGSN